MTEMPLPRLPMPRRLAIRLLHEAQIASPQPIHGWVLVRDGRPGAYIAGDEAPAGQAIWARVWSAPQAPAEPAPEQLRPGELALLVGLGTRGVLEMRAWERVRGAVRERELHLHD